MRRTAIVLSLFASVLLTDVHWSLLQMVTWAKMIQQSDSDATLGEKVLATITGEAPCAHCFALVEERNSERERILDLIAKGPILSPIAPSHTRVFHARIELFSFAPPHLVSMMGVPVEIDRPPQS